MKFFSEPAPVETVEIAFDVSGSANLTLAEIESLDQIAVAAKVFKLSFCHSIVS